MSMRRLAISGPGAERAAAVRIRSLSAEGMRVAARRLPTPMDVAEEFVAAHGVLWPNACFWLEWASGQALPPCAMHDADADAVVLAIPDCSTEPFGFEIEYAADVPLGLDAFGRPGGNAGGDSASDGLVVGICGTEQHHRKVYPAVLASLGDAAFRTGLAVTPQFLPASQVLAAGVPPGVDALLLPGGSDLTEAASQIVAARAGRERAIPTLGLCLGMQSMATMALRDAGRRDAALEEIAGPGFGRSFVRLRDDNGAPVHRLGDRALCPAPSTQLAAILPGGATVRMNHRYRFDPAPCGLALHQAEVDGIVDAIELLGHPFFIGLQGHPELGCDPALHRLWDQFLAAAARADPFRSNEAI